VFRFKSPGFLGAHKVRGTGVPPVSDWAVRDSSLSYSEEASYRQGIHERGTTVPDPG